MSEGPVYQPIPDDSSRAKTVVAVIAATVLIALLVAGSWWVFGRNHQPDAQQPGSFLPVETTPAVEPTATAAQTSSAEPTAPAPAVPATSAPAPPKPRLAFRLGRTLYLAGFDGSNPVAVIPAAEGPYAASPNGQMIAWVDPKTKKLTIAGVGMDPKAIDAPAAPVRPVWLADSSAVLFRRAETSSTLAPQIMHASVAASTTPYTVGNALYFAANADNVIAMGPQDDSGAAARRVDVLDAGTRSTLVAPGAVSGLALGKDTLYLAVREPTSTVGIWSVGFDGSKLRHIVTALPKGETGSITDLTLSPNGSTLAFAVTGDDGYSRLYAVPTSGGTPVKLSIRRDDYPLTWTPDSSLLLFIEGNTFQGEQTGLMRVLPDGTKRFLVVTGATL